MPLPRRRTELELLGLYPSRSDFQLDRMEAPDLGIAHETWLQSRSGSHRPRQEGKEGKMSEPLWWITKDGDGKCLAMYERHYSATRHEGQLAQFVGPGEKFVFTDVDWRCVLCVAEIYR